MLDDRKVYNSPSFLKKDANASDDNLTWGHRDDAWIEFIRLDLFFMLDIISTVCSDLDDNFFRFVTAKTEKIDLTTKKPTEMWTQIMYSLYLPIVITIFLKWWR